MGRAASTARGSRGRVRLAGATIDGGRTGSACGLGSSTETSVQLTPPLEMPAMLTISPAPACSTTAFSRPMRPKILVTLPSPCFVPSGARATSLSPTLRSPLSTRPKYSMPT